MAEYLTTADQNVALNAPILFTLASIPCRAGNVLATSPGILTLRGNTHNCFARYVVSLSANVQIPTGGTVTPIALAITLNGEPLPESVAIINVAAVEEYQHIFTQATITVPSGCCFNVSARYIDATDDDPAIVGTPAITVRRAAALRVERVA